MKLSRFTIALFIILFLIVSLVLISDTNRRNENRRIDFSESPGSGTAIIMTGAAARITQQVALLEELYNRGVLKDVVFISGVSSGALNAVMLNAILSGKLTWQEYKDILFNIRNSDIYLSGEGKLPVNTGPSRKLLTEVVEGKLGYRTIGDLPIMTEISFSNFSGLKTRQRVFRMCSRKINSESDTTLNLVDILMASTAIPVVFPPARIGNVSTIPDIEYTDGGVGIDYIPFTALLDFQKWRGERVKNVYIISRTFGVFDEFSQEMKMLGINNKGRIDRIGTSLDNIIWWIMINRLEAFAREAPEMINGSYVWIPHLEQDFLMLNFDNLEEQYFITKSWAQSNDPVPLGDFILYNKLTKGGKRF
ncbi:MAG TPA: patatin-like phospholipase family protein [Bacteroidales bacterium]|nr:patatin-like phospholipase family protein [Bacteroidales bacterium]